MLCGVWAGCIASVTGTAQQEWGKGVVGTPPRGISTVTMNQNAVSNVVAIFLFGILFYSTILVHNINLVYNSHLYWELVTIHTVHLYVCFADIKCWCGVCKMVINRWALGGHYLSGWSLPVHAWLSTLLKICNLEYILCIKNVPRVHFTGNS